MDRPDIPAATARTPRWPWLCLIAAMAWVALVRVPLVLNAEVHLDSDLAVDGLTLLDAAQGHVRWHFPGTPYMGIGPILLSLPGALLFGVKPSTLVVGGVIAYEMFVVATFVLVRRVFGPVAAVGALVPMAFASVGTVWLSGRLTGGHLLTLAWHVGALAMVPTFRQRGGYLRGLLFGAWCGLGYYLDGMFVMTLPFVAALAVASVLGAPGGFVRRIALIFLMAVGFAIGDLPQARSSARARPARRVSGPISHHPRTRRRRPHRRCPGQGAIHRSPQAARARMPAQTHRRTPPCLRRAADRAEAGSALAGGGPTLGRAASPFVAWGTVVCSVVLFPAAILALAWAGVLPGKDDSEGLAEGVAASEPSTPCWALSMLGSSVLVAAFFIINMNIFNADNYRYLVYWLAPWAGGYGLTMAGLWRRGSCR